MTINYLIALGDDGRLSKLEQHISGLAGYSCLRPLPGCLVWLGDIAKFHPVANDGGFVLGTLFHRNGDAFPIDELDPVDRGAIRSTGGGHLIEHFWGSYVAVLPTTRGIRMVRDPSGTLPCSYIMQRDLLVACSNLELLVDAGFLRPEPDWFGLARSLFLPALPTERTALTNVHDLLPGMSLEMGDGNASTSLRWNPWDYVRFEPGETQEANSDQLRRVAQHCINGWSRVYERGLVAVSGGLDSSIVAAGLKKAGNSFSCVTLVTNDPLGDERSYCRALCHHLGVPLYEGDYSLRDVSLDRTSIAQRPRPLGRLDAQAYDAAIVRMGRRAGSNALFTGNGGDNVFYLSNSARALADRFLVEGPSKRLLSTSQDICRLTGASMWQVLTHGWQALRASRSAYTWRTDGQFLSRGALCDQSEEPAVHPWLTLPEERRLPGKAAHIAMMLRMQHSIEAHAERGDIAVVHPLVSQPLVELCLNIPAWQQCAGGRNRSAARQAFAAELPSVIISREGKGSPQGFAYEIFQHFRSEIRERLLGGALVQNGLLDKVLVEEALKPDTQNAASTILRISLLVDAEAWINHWRGRRGHAAIASRADG